MNVSISEFHVRRDFKVEIDGEQRSASPDEARRVNPGETYARILLKIPEGMHIIPPEQQKGIVPSHTRMLGMDGRLLPIGYWAEGIVYVAVDNPEIIPWTMNTAPKAPFDVLDPDKKTRTVVQLCPTGVQLEDNSFVYYGDLLHGYRYYEMNTPLLRCGSVI